MPEKSLIPIPKNLQSLTPKIPKNPFPKPSLVRNRNDDLTFSLTLFRFKNKLMTIVIFTLNKKLTFSNDNGIFSIITQNYSLFLLCYTLLKFKILLTHHVMVTIFWLTNIFSKSFIIKPSSCRNRIRFRRFNLLFKNHYRNDQNDFYEYCHLFS